MQNLGLKTFTIFFCAVGNKVVNYTASFLPINMEFSCSTEMSEWDSTLLKPLENPLF